MTCAMTPSGKSRPPALQPKTEASPHPPPLPGLDSAVVAAALSAGVLEDQLQRMSKLQRARGLVPARATLEDLLDKAEGGDGSQGSEELVAEDALLSKGGLGQEEVKCTARGWTEHRSLLQSFPGPIRNAGLLGGIVDAINSGEVERAKSIALLGVAALDQASIDGSWIIAGKIGLE
eukprot:s6856_g2.t1